MTESKHIQRPQDGSSPGSGWPDGVQFLPFAGLVLVLACVLASGTDHYLTPAYFAYQASVIADWADANPVAAALGFTLITSAAFAIALPAGMTLLAIIGGNLFGTWIGAGLYTAAATGGSLALFLAARSPIAGVLDRKTRPVRESTAGLIRREAFWLILSMRLMPPVPAAIVTLAAAGAATHPRSFVMATAAGLAPGALMLSYMGSSLAMGDVPDDRALWRLPELAVLLGLATCALTPALARVLWHRSPNV